MQLWRKSRHSIQGDGQCTEVMADAGTVAVRDSKNPHGGVVRVPHNEWIRFTLAIKSGELTLAL